MVSAIARTTTNRSLEDCSDEELFAILRSEGDERAKATLVHRYEGLARATARRFSRSGESFDDLSQIAIVGLLAAIDRFDPDRGVAFPSFAMPTIRGELKRWFRDHGWAVHVPRRVKQLNVALGDATAALTQSLGRPPSDEELADALAVDPEDIEEARIAGCGYRPTSLNATPGDDSPAIESMLGAIDASIGAVDERVTVRPLLASLPERHRQILHLRFFEGLSQTEIARRMGISQVHVSRLLSRSLETLRRSVED